MTQTSPQSPTAPTDGTTIQHTAPRTTRRSYLRLAVLAGSALGATALAACAQNSAGPASSTGVAADGKAKKGPPVEITFNTWYDKVTQPIVPLFANFEQAHNVKLTYDINSNNRDMAKYTAWFVSGSAPDVVNGENFSWSQFYNTGVILDLTEYLKKDKIDLAKQYALMGSEIWCGKNYAMPFDADPRVVYYNKTLLKQAGAKDPWDDFKGQWTFDDMLEMMTKTAKVQGNSGTDVYGLRMSYTSMNEGNGMYVWSFGGKWADFDAMKYTLDSPESIEAHNYVLDLFNRRLIMPNSVSDELGKDEKPFTNGRAVFRIRAAASNVVINKDIAGSFDYDIAPFPGRKKGTPGVTIVSGNPHTAAKTTKHPDESYEFMKWLAGPEVQGYWAKEKIQFPTLKSAQADFAKDAKQHIHVFADAYKIPYGIHFRHNNTSRHYSEYGKEIAPVFDGQKGMTDFLKSFTARVNNEVEYGGCMPYKGMAVPIKP